jgi:hypothetical protein
MLKKGNRINLKVNDFMGRFKFETIVMNVNKISIERIWLSLPSLVYLKIKLNGEGQFVSLTIQYKDALTKPKSSEKDNFM